MQITECVKEPELKAAYQVLREHYTNLSELDYLRYVREMTATGFRMIAVIENEKCIAVCGFRVGRRFYCGKFLHIDNMIVQSAYRSQGIGTLIINWMRTEAIRLNCDVLLADTYINNSNAQRFFEREGFYKRGYHLKFDLT